MAPDRSTSPSVLRVPCPRRPWRRLKRALADFERQLMRDRTMAGLEAARVRGRVGGRPTVMTPPRVEAARSLLAVSVASVASVAEGLGVSRATLYRTVLVDGVESSPRLSVDGGSAEPGSRRGVAGSD